jgi:hypothetical protein
VGSDLQIFDSLSNPSAFPLQDGNTSMFAVAHKFALHCSRRTLFSHEWKSVSVGPDDRQTDNLVGNIPCPIARIHEPKAKAGICVRTVSTVCGRVERFRDLARIHINSCDRSAPGSIQAIFFCRGFGPTLAGPADGTGGADVTFRRSAYPDYSGSSSAFTTERNIDANRPK